MSSRRAVAKSEVDPPRLDVIAEERAGTAVDLYLAGHRWDVIAERVGYASPRVAAMTVRARLQKAAVEQSPNRRQYELELALARLDALQAAWWDRALGGDHIAAKLVLKILSDRARLLCLGGDPAHAESERVLVVAGSPEEYVAQLKAVISENEETIEQFWPRDAPVGPDGRVHPVGVLEGIMSESGR